MMMMELDFVFGTCWYDTGGWYGWYRYCTVYYLFRRISVFALYDFKQYHHTTSLLLLLASTVAIHLRCSLFHSIIIIILVIVSSRQKVSFFVYKSHNLVTHTQLYETLIRVVTCRIFSGSCCLLPENLDTNKKDVN
jgi:hypothetical protein